MPEGAYALVPKGELAYAECAVEGSSRRLLPRPGVRRIGRVRIPLTLTCRPWATAYRCPDGRVVWCLRLWVVDGPRTACRTTRQLEDYCRASGLGATATAVRRIADR